MLLSTTDITYFITAATLLISSLLITRKYLHEKNIMLQYFAYFLFFTGIASTIWGLGSVASQTDPLWSAVSYPIGIFIGGVGLTFFTRLSMNFFLPQYRRILFWLMLIGNFLMGIFLSFNTPNVFRTSAGVAVWDLTPTVSILVFTMGIFITFFNVIIFFHESRKVSNKLLKLRAILIGVALFCYMLGGLSLNLHTQENLVIASNMLTTLGPIILLVAIYLPQIHAIKKNNS